MAVDPQLRDDQRRDDQRRDDRRRDDRRRDDEPGDLLGRWQAYRAQRPVQSTPVRDTPSDQDPDRPAPADSGTRRMPAAATPSSAVEADPAPAPGWEPVVTASVRNAEQAQAEAPAQSAGADTVPAPAHTNVPERQPGTQQETQPRPAPIPTAGKRRAAPVPRGTPREREQRPVRAAHRARTGDAARDLVAAKREQVRAIVGAGTSGDAAPQAIAGGRPRPAPVRVTAPPTKPSRRDEVAHEMPGVYQFAPKRSSRRLLTLCMVAGVAASAFFVRSAVEAKDTPSIGLAAIVVLATAMLWAIRAGATLTRLTVRQGQLEVFRQGERLVFDMASDYTVIEVHGRPGSKGWKVLFPRRGMAPFAIDASMVDPDDFMRVLRFFRPNLVQR